MKKRSSFEARLSRRIGKQYQIARESVGLTRRELAKVAGVPLVAITSSERGHYVLNEKAHYRIIFALDARGAKMTAMIPPDVRARLTPDP